jgi:hypothetical protein
MERLNCLWNRHEILTAHDEFAIKPNCWTGVPSQLHVVRRRLFQQLDCGGPPREPAGMQMALISSTMVDLNKLIAY